MKLVVFDLYWREKTVHFSKGQGRDEISLDVFRLLAWHVRLCAALFW